MCETLDDVRDLVDGVREIVNEISSMPDVRQQQTIAPALFAETMRSILYVGRDAEATHRGMDHLMCDVLRSMGYDEGIDVFERALKWYV